MTNHSTNATAHDVVGLAQRDRFAAELEIAAVASRVVGRRRSAASVGMALWGPLIVIALCVARSPAIMAHGRLWAEESVFFAHMQGTRYFLHQVFHVYRGHIELINSGVFALAGHLGLGLIPLLTTYCGLLLQCILAFMVVYFRENLGIRSRSALLICILIVVSPCAVENYLNLLNSVWVTSAILLVVIHLPATRLSNRGLVIVPSTLVLGLSGIPAACLMPLALLHSIVWRSRPHLLIATTLTVCCVIQGALVLKNGADGRFASVSAWVYLAGPFFHIVVEHLSGVDAASALSHWFTGAITHAEWPLSVMLVPVAIVAWMALHILRKGDTRSKLLLTAIVYVTTFNTMFALGDRNDLFTVYAMRYFFVPSMALALLMARTDRFSPTWPKGLVFGVMVVVALVSVKDFFVNPFYRTYVEQQHEWHRDVERCRASTTACTIEIAPGNGMVNVSDAMLGREMR